MDRQIEEIDRIMLWRGKGTENEKGGDGEISCIKRIFLNFFFFVVQKWSYIYILQHIWWCKSADIDKKFLSAEINGQSTKRI